MSKFTTASTALFKPLSQPYKPHGYNKKAIKFLLEHAAAALFQDPGMGKTAETLAAASYLLKKNVARKILIIAPLRVCYSVWPKEAAKWSDFEHLKIALLHGPKKDAALKSDADIYLINPEGLEWLFEIVKTKTASGKTKVSMDLRRWKKLDFDTLVIDELSKFKHVNTNRFKALKLVVPSFKRRWGLTGSPASNGLLDLLGQCFVLDEGRSLGQYVTHYRTKYFETVDKQGFVWKCRKGAEEQIYERLSPLALRMAAEDFLEMPQLVENVIKLDLPDAIKPFYEHLHEDLIAGINDHTIVAANAAVASGKARQVANGGIYLTPDLDITGFKLPKQKREGLNLQTVKVDTLADLIDELQGSPLLVAYDFEHDLDRLRGKLGQDVPYIGGGVSTKRSTELELLWNAGKLPVLLGHPQAIGHGLNLQEVGHHVCWHSMRS